MVIKSGEQGKGVQIGKWWVVGQNSQLPGIERRQSIKHSISMICNLLDSDLGIGDLLNKVPNFFLVISYF